MEAKESPDVKSGNQGKKSANRSTFRKCSVNDARPSSARKKMVRVSEIWDLLHSHIGKFKIHAPGSTDSARILSSIRDSDKLKLQKAGGDTNVFVIVSEKKNPTSCFIFTSAFFAYRADPLSEERRLLRALQEIRAEKFITDTWRLAQSCLEFQPNVCVALVGTAEALQAKISARISSSAVDAAILHFCVPLLQIMDRKLPNLISWCQEAVKDSLSHDSYKPKERERLMHALSSTEVGHHIKLVQEMSHQWRPCFDERVQQLCMLLILQNDIGSRKCSVDCPGGKRDLGESSTDAAVRELAEETGITIDLTDLQYRQVFMGCPGGTNPLFNKTSQLFVVEVSLNATERGGIEASLDNLKL